MRVRRIHLEVPKRDVVAVEVRRWRRDTDRGVGRVTVVPSASTTASTSPAARILRARAAEAEDGVKLDPVRCDAGLSVDLVPEPDPSDDDLAAQLREIG